MLTIIIFNIAFTGCSKNTIEEEKFAFPEGEYPKLGEVPDRPAYISKSELKDITEKLSLANRSAHNAVKSVD